MTDPNGWPDKPGVPLNPERDGFHLWSGPYADAPTVAEWSSFGFWRPGLAPEAMAHFTYHGPLYTEVEVAAREQTAARNAEWGAYNDVLAWINTQHAKMISKGALYEAVMEMRPKGCADLDAMLAAARREGMKEAARIATEAGFNPSGYVTQEKIAAAIRARAEEIKP